MCYILFWKFVEEDMNSVFWNLKRIGDGLGDVLDELFFLLRSSPRKQTDLYGWHLLLLSDEVLRVREVRSRDTIHDVYGLNTFHHESFP